MTGERHSWYREYAESCIRQQADDRDCVPEPGFAAGPMTDGLRPCMDADGCGAQTDWDAVVKACEVQKP